MQKILFLKIQIVLAFVFFANCCMDGCLNCQLSQSDGIEFCTLCMEGFKLQQNQCIVNECENYQFYEDPSSNICVSLCNQNTIGVYGQSTCQQSSSCSKQFIQQSSISQQQSIQQVQYYVSNTIITIFTNFFNIIDASTGAFIRSQTFNQNIILIRSFKNSIYMFSNANQIFQWDINLNEMKLISTVLQGFISSKSNIIQLSNNEHRIFLSSFSNKAQQIIFNEINKETSNFISLKYDKLVTVIEGIIILQNNQFQIMLINLVEQPNKDVAFNNITNFYSCDGIFGGASQLKVSISSQTYYLLFQNTSSIYSISQKTQQCQSSKETSTPLKILLIQINSSVASDEFNQLLLASFSSNQFKIYNPRTLVSLIEITIDNQIIDFNSFVENGSMGKIYFLKQNKSIDIYQINFDQSAITLNKINNLQSLISNPTQIKFIYKEISSSIPQQIGIVGQDIQLIDRSQDTISGITVNYQEVANYNEDQINKLYYAEEINLSISCSQDGKLVVWEQSDPLYPQFYYQIQFPSQSCINVVVFQSRLAVSIFTNQIFIFNIFNSQISQLIQINIQYPSGISVSNDYIFLFFNQQIQVMIDINKLLLIYQIFQQALNILYSNSNDIYILDSTNTITAYYLINGEIKLKPSISPFSFQVSLVKSDLFNLDNGDIHLMLTDTNNQITILNSQLQILFPIIQLDGNNMQIYQYNSTLYFLLLFAPNKNKAFPFALECIDLLNVNPIVLNVHQVAQCIQIVYVKKKKNGLPQQDYFFQVVAVAPLGSTTNIFEVIWNKKLQNNVLEKCIFSPNQTIKITHTDKGNTLIMGGSQSGFVGVVPYNKQNSVQKIFQLPVSPTDDQINKFYYSFMLGLMFIQARKDVYVFSIFTNQQIQKLSINDVTDDSDIQEVQYSEISKVFIFYSKFQLFLVSTITNSKYQVILTQSSQNQKLIYGCLIDDQNQQIIVQGDSLVSYDFTLSNQKVISTSFQQNYTSCIYLPSNIVCIMNSNQIQFFNRGNQLVSTTILTITSMDKFRIFGDDENQCLYVYQNMIEVYTFEGVIKRSFTQMNMNIFQLQLAGQYLVAYTAPIAYIISRADLNLVTTFQPSGGSLTKGFYFSEINLIVYFTDEIRFGQIKFYNLNNFQALSSFTNLITQNQVGLPIKVYYDADNSMINYIDQYGNQQLANYGAQMKSYNTIAVPEMQQQLTTQPTDMITNFDMNESYVYNNSGVWRINNSVLLKVLLGSHYNNKQLYMLINTENDSTQNNASMLFVDKNNNLFNYQNFQVTFQAVLDQKVQEMKVIYQQNIRFNIIVFPSQILFLKGEEVSFSNLNQAQTIQNINLRQFIYTHNGYAIYQTNQNEIIDYDFVQNQKLQSFKFDQDSIILDVLVYFNPIDLQNLFIYFSINNGLIYQYNLINKIHSVYSLFQQQEIILSFVMLNYPNMALLMKSGRIAEVDCRNFSLNINQNLDQVAKNFEIPVTEPKTQKNPLLYYDFQGNYFYLSIAEEKKLGAFRISDNQLIATLTFPLSYRKSFNITNKYIILGCPYQLNFYDRQFNYIGRFRRSISKQINQIIEIFDDYFFIVQSDCIETIFINQATSQIQLIDNISLQNPFIYYQQLIDNQSSIKIIGISQLGVFEERLSVQFFQQQAQSVNNQMLSCTADISYFDIVQVQNDFYSIYTAQDVSKNFYLSVMINNEIKQLNFLNQQNIQFILRPQNINNNFLKINSKSFSSITSNLYISSFILEFTEQGLPINFSPNSQNITLQNITISNQNINIGTSLNFLNNQIIQITNMKIENINLQNGVSKNATTILKKSQSLFSFNGIQYILIEEMTITNLNQVESQFQLINASNVKEVIIRKLKVTNSIFSKNFVELNWLVNLRVMDLQILNCQRTQLEKDVSIIYSNYLIQLNGIEVIQMFYISLENNKEIQFIQTNNAYKLSNLTNILNNDTIFIQNAHFIGNQFPNQFDSDNQIHLLLLQSSFAQIQTIKFQLNQGNIFIQNAQEFSLDSSTFEYNQGVLGASIQFQNIQQEVTIKNSNFSSNIAQASGGALYFLNINYLQIDQNTNFYNNSALIGGAIRFVISDQQYKNLFLENQYQSFVKSKFNQNSAQIFGQNIASYPSSFQIAQLKANQVDNQSILYKGKLKDIITDVINIRDLQSGGNVYLNIQLLDEQDKIIQLDSDKIQTKQYPLSIRNELQDYQIQIYGNPSNKNLEIKGESLINTKQYNSKVMAFQFSNIVFSANPRQIITNSASLLIQVNNWHENYEISFFLSFRECIKGEIPVQTSQTITFCLECSEGTYSLISDFKIQNQEISCKKCPTGASNCQGDQIILKQGYWRLNNDTDAIIQCNQMKPEICDFNSFSSQFGCIEGHIGPLCETCDNFGDVWKGKTYSLSFSDYICLECSNSTIQIVYVILIFFAVLAYLYLSIIIFLNNYIYNSICSYIRLMNMLPFSKSCILDESVFIIKQLINFLQISQVIYQIDINFIPQAFSFIPSIAGQPMGKIIVSSQCLYTSLRYYLGLVQEIEIRSIIYIFVPIFFLLILLFVLKFQIYFKLFKINKYHQYVLLTILFFFFQPDNIQFLASTMTCRQVGDQKYVTTSLVLDCENKNFTYFQYYAILPALIFWVLCPLFIFYFFIKDTKKFKNINYCINKYKYGYYFLEYKQKYYFWEFIRIYYRIVLVLGFTLLQKLDYTSQFLCIIIISSYSCALLNYKPFSDHHLQRIEIFSNFILILNTFLNALLKLYNNITIQIIISVLHYGFVLIMVGIIVKMKLNNSQLLNSRIAQCLVRNILPQKIKRKIENTKILKSRALKLWKKIYSNKTTIRQQKIVEQTKKIQQSFFKSSCISNMIEDKVLEGDDNKELIHSKSFQQYFAQNLIQLSTLNDQEGSPSSNSQSIQKRLNVENFKLLQNKSPKARLNNQFKLLQDKEYNFSAFVNFPNIEESDFDEQQKARQIYNNKNVNQQSYKFNQI